MLTSPAAHRPLRRLGALLAVLTLATGLSTAGAQTSEIEEAKAEREREREAAAEAASELDPLLTEDEELEAAVEALELLVATQEAKLEATRQALDTARLESDAATERVDDMTETIAVLREALRDRSVEAYISPAGGQVDTLLDSNDVTVAAHKRALLDTINASEADLLDQLRAAEDTLVDLELDAQAAVETVEAEEAAVAEQLAELEVSLAEQERIKQALEERIAGLAAEIDAHEAAEDELTGLITALIAEEDARIAAAEEARRVAEERQRAAEQTGDEGSGNLPPPSPPPPAPSTASGLVWPSAGVVTSSFGPRWGRQHEGIDIAAPTGTPLYAVQSGSIANAGVLSGYGNVVIIDHGGGFTTIYAHLSEIYVSAGQSVGQGANIGLMGCTGSCTGPHLHFETRINGIAQDPMLYL